MAQSGFSNYPDGFNTGVTIKNVPVVNSHPGKVFWVGNNATLVKGEVGASNGNDGSYLKPFSTVAGAFSACAASRGDVVYVRPGYTQTVSSAGGLTFSKAGVSVIGLGEGSTRPTFSLSATDSTIAMSAANCRFENCIVKATVDSVVSGVIISAAGCTVDIETQDTSSAVEFVNAISTTSGGDNVKIKARHRGFAAGDAMTRYIDVVGCTDAQIDVDFFGIASTSVVDLRTTACDNVRVTGKFYNDSVALTKNVTNNTTSTWSVEGYDCKAARHFAGSDDQAVHYTDQEADPSTRAGSTFSIVSTVTSSSIPNNTQTGGAITAASSGGLILESMILQTNGTGIVNPTNLEFTTDNAKGLTGAAGPSALVAVSGLGANKTVVVGFDAANEKLPLYLESGKKIYVDGDDGAGTGAGTMDVIMTFRRVTDGATITAVNLP